MINILSQRRLCDKTETNHMSNIIIVNIFVKKTEEAASEGL